MEAYRCKYCGGFVNPRTYKCEYCGTQYKKPDLVRYAPQSLVVSVPAPCDTVTCAIRIGMEQYKTMRDMDIPIESYVHEELAYRIADSIAPKLEIHEENDIAGFSKVFSARLRVVKPEFRF